MIPLTRCFSGRDNDGLTHGVSNYSSGWGTMLSIYPNNQVQKVLEKLEAIDVLEYLDWHPETFQLGQGTVRAFCPVHKEEKFRTLVIDKSKKTCYCSRLSCPISEGGDLIQLYALSQKIAYDDALRILVAEYSIDVPLAEEPEEIYRRVVEAENRIQLARVEPEKRPTHLKEARLRLDSVLQDDPTNLRVLRAQVRYLREVEDTSELVPWLVKLSVAEDEAKNFEPGERLLKGALAKDETNRPLLWRLSEHYKTRKMKDQALEQLMRIADLSEMEGDYQGAIEAYRAVDGLASAEIDVTPMISQLLVLLDNNVEAAREMVRQADRARAENKLKEARQILMEALEQDPESEEAVLSLIKTQGAMGISRKEFMSALRHVDKLMERGKWQSYIDLLETMDSIYPGDTNLVERLVVGYTELGNQPKAREMRFKALELYRAENDLDACKMMLEGMIAQDPGDKEALARAASLLIEMKDSEAAIAQLRLLVNLHEKDKEYDEAISVYRRMQEIAPDSARITLAFVALLIKLERKKVAVDVLAKSIDVLKAESNMTGLRQVVEQALQIVPEKPEFLLAYSQALEALGESVKASLQAVKACRNFIERGKFAEACQELENLLQRDPTNARAQQELANVLDKLNKPEAAAGHLQELAGLLFKQGDYLDCQNVLQELARRNQARIVDLERLINVSQILKNTDENKRARLLLAQKYAEENQFPEALREVNRLVELEPQNEDYLRYQIALYSQSGNSTDWGVSTWGLALRFQKQGNVEGEKEILRELLAQRERDFDAHERLIELEFAGGTINETLKNLLDDYLKMIIEERQLDRCVSRLTEWKARETKTTVFQEARVKLYQLANETEGEIAQLRTLVTLMEDQNKLEDAVPRYEKLLELAPGDVETYRRLAEIYRDLNKPQDGIDVLLRLAAYFTRNHRPGEAEDVFEEIFEQDPENERAYMGLAEFYRQLGGRDKEALQNLREAALLHSRRGDFVGAEAILKSGLEILPDSTLIQRELVNLFLDVENRNLERALKELAQLAEFHNNHGERDSYYAARREAINLQPETEALRRVLIKAYQDDHRESLAIHELVDYGRFLKEKTLYKEAMVCCKEALEIDPQSLAARSLQAELLKAQGKTEEALAAWQELAPLLQALGTQALAKKVSGNFSERSARDFSAANAGSQKQQQRPGLSLIADYDFDHLIVGENNRFAVATAKAIAKAPGETPHNPLFLYADVGLGKTHLLHAIANQVLRREDNPAIVYTNSEQFSSELIDSIQENSLQEFRDRYRSCELILIDDIHFLAGKESSQEEFFHLFNSLFQAKKQIVMTSDRPPKDIAHLEKRLKSRFGSGVIVEIKPPNYETRLAILHRLAKEFPHITMPEGFLNRIAENVSNNIRELKAAFNQLIAQHEIGGEPLNDQTLNTFLATYSESNTTA